MGLGTGSWRSRWLCAAALSGAALLLGAAPAAADTTITVNTTLSSSPSGDGLCSLAEAIDWADGGSDPDCSAASASGTTTINLPAGKYVVSQTLKLSGSTNIAGAGANTTDIDGGGAVQVVYVWPAGNVEISGVEVSGGNSGTSTSGCSGLCFAPEPGNDGGGIYNDGVLRLVDDEITGNATGGGTDGLTFCIFGGCAGNSGEAGGNGGGIYNSGTLEIDGSTVTDNTTGAGAAGGAGISGTSTPGEDGGAGGDGGSGAGVYNNGGALTISDSTISGNSTGPGGNGGDGSAPSMANSPGGNAGAGGDAGGGGGIQSENGSVTITGSTLANNRTGAGSAPGTPAAGTGTGAYGSIAAAGNGGVGGGLIYEALGGNTATLTNDTFTGNATGAAATGTDPGHGGIAGAIGFRGTGSLTNVTIAGNSSSYAAGAIYLIPGSTLIEQGSIIASNRASLDDNCAGVPLTDAGHNIVYGENTCPGTSADPKLQALADNGGPTQTVRLSAGSPAIDAVPAGACTVATDQRGVSRPQGGACDAGAYEVAPPGLAAIAATAAGPASATVSGQITPNLTDTQVTVRYGTSTGYGSTTAATDIGAGPAAKPLAVTVSGLQAGTVYHLQVIATNADGTSTSGDLTLTTAAAPTTPAAPAAPVAMAASVQRTKVTGDVVSVTLACTAGSAGCAGGVTLQSRVTTSGRNVVKVTAASAGRRSARPKRTTTTRTVGSGSYTLAAGQTAIVRLALNSLGKRLLKARHRLPTTLETSGSGAVRTHVTFIYRPPRRRKR